MATNGSGLQAKTLRNIVLAWVLRSRSRSSWGQGYSAPDSSSFCAFSEGKLPRVRSRRPGRSRTRRRVRWVPITHHREGATRCPRSPSSRATHDARVTCARRSEPSKTPRSIFFRGTTPRSKPRSTRSCSVGPSRSFWTSTPSLVLDTEGLRGLIALLRRARLKGAQIALRSSREEILRTLSVTGLDRVFTIK